MKTLVACTAEIDDIEVAVKEILDQLDVENSLCKNTVGIMTCHYEFVDSGAAKAISEALSFDVIGVVSLTEAVNTETGTLLLTLMVLTDDQDIFVPKLTSSLLENPGKAIREAYVAAAAEQDDKPALVLTFAPFIMQNNGDDYADTITEASGGIPCFGTVAVDGTNDFSNSYMLYNGEAYLDRMGMIVLYTQRVPKFFLATISPEKIYDKPAVVTKSQGHILMEVNGRPLIHYFEELGLADASQEQYAMASVPFMMDYGDGTPPVSKVFIAYTPEQYGVCAAVMPEGATLNVGELDKEDVLFTSAQAVDHAMEDISKGAGVLIFSCLARNMSLGVDVLAEANLIREKLKDKVPFMMACSGGEFCPTQVSNTKGINRFHNNTFVACIL